MTAPTPPAELMAQIWPLIEKWLPDAHLRATSLVEELYPLIAAHVAKQAGEICERRIDYSMQIPCPDNFPGCLVGHFVPATRNATGPECAEAIERELGSKK